MIQDVRPFRTELHGLSLRHSEDSGQTAVDRPASRTKDGTRSQIPESADIRYCERIRVEPQALESRSLSEVVRTFIGVRGRADLICILGRCIFAVQCTIRPANQGECASGHNACDARDPPVAGYSVQPGI